MDALVQTDFFDKEDPHLALSKQILCTINYNKLITEISLSELIDTFKQISILTFSDSYTSSYS